MPNALDQDDVFYFDEEELEDLQKITDEDFFDFLEQENRKQKVNELIKKIIEDKKEDNN